MHGTRSPALVYVISPSGDVRKIRIDAGDSKSVARSLKSYEGRLAVQFDKEAGSGGRQSLLKVTDLAGNSIATYRVDPTAVGGRSFFLAGYGPDGFTFVPFYSENKMYVVKAKLP